MAKKRENDHGDDGSSSGSQYSNKTEDEDESSSDDADEREKKKRKTEKDAHRTRTGGKGRENAASKKQKQEESDAAAIKAYVPDFANLFTGEILPLVQQNKACFWPLLHNTSKPLTPRQQGVNVLKYFIYWNKFQGKLTIAPTPKFLDQGRIENHQEAWCRRQTKKGHGLEMEGRPRARLPRLVQVYCY